MGRHPQVVYQVESFPLDSSVLRIESCDCNFAEGFFAFKFPRQLHSTIREEFGPKFKHVNGEKNVVADALSQLEMEA